MVTNFSWIKNYSLKMMNLEYKDLMDSRLHGNDGVTNNINDAIYDLQVDHLYHLGIDLDDSLKNEFSGIKYVIYTRSNTDIRIIVNKFAKLYYDIYENSFSFQPIYKTERYNLYRVGEVLFLSHGIGAPSLLIALNEVAKLLIHTVGENFIFIKINTAMTELFGPTEIHVVTDALNSEFEAKYINVECGKEVSYFTNLNQELIKEILAFNQKQAKFDIQMSKSLSSNILLFLEMADFAKDEMETYKVMGKEYGVGSIDFESDCFAGFCNTLNTPSLILNYSRNSGLAKNNAENLVVWYVLSKIIR